MFVVVFNLLLPLFVEWLLAGYGAVSQAVEEGEPGGRAGGTSFESHGRRGPEVVKNVSAPALLSQSVIPFPFPSLGCQARLSPGPTHVRVPSTQKKRRGHTP